MNKYWIPHQDIHRKVITQELQYYLGPQATVRPYTLEVYAFSANLGISLHSCIPLRARMGFSSARQGLV